MAFNPRVRAFDESFKLQAYLCAERVGRALERDALVKTRSHEATFAAIGMTLESLAHEVKTEMVTIAAQTSTLAKSLLDGDLLDTQSVDILDRSARSATAKVKALLGVRASRETVDVRECVRRAARRCRTIVYETLRHAHQIEIVTPGANADGVWPVKASPASLIIIFFNLYLNAAQQIDQMASAGIRQWGRIEHSWRIRRDDIEKDCAIIRIHDTGPGIHRDDWERIFEPGYSTKPEGTGLGLHICRGLLSEIGGTVKVTKSCIWDGSTFTVSIPLCPVLKETR